MQTQSQFKKLSIVFLAAVTGILMVNSACQQQEVSTYKGLSVKGTDLYTKAGEQVVLRGVNKMVYITDKDGSKTFPEIAKTGANTVRIFWFTKGTPEELDKVLTNAHKHKMIPIVAVWEATGKWHQMDTIIDYWTRSDIAEVFKKHERYTILNIANEGGNNDVTNEQFRDVYAEAINRIRASGIEVPLMIDAAGWGRKESYLIDNGEYLLNQDPDKNIIFSWHPWDSNQPQSRYDAAFESMRAKNLCLVIGEYSEKEVGCKCCIDYDYILELCEQTDTGWLAWSWGPGNSDCADMDMTEDGNYNTLHGYGLDIAVEHKFSIKNTSERPQSLWSN